MTRLILQVLLVAIIALGFLPADEPIEINGPHGAVVTR
jgi:hypothetical protein